MAHRRRGATYVGVTNGLIRRVHEHRTKAVKGHTERYGIARLVYYETHDDIAAAIRRERTLKHWVQAWKWDLIESVNPRWDDLWDEIVKSPF